METTLAITPMPFTFLNQTMIQAYRQSALYFRVNRLWLKLQRLWEELYQRWTDFARVVQQYNETLNRLCQAWAQMVGFDKVWRV